MKQQHTMTIHHDKPVGVDSFFREIFPGDTVRDADGKEYTIDERGWARPMDGSTGCGFKKLKDPAFVRKGETPDTRFQEDASGKVAPALKVEASGPEGDVPTKEEIAALPEVKKHEAPEPRPEPTSRRTGGRVNNSGVVQIESLARKAGAKGIAGLAAYLRDHDIEVTFIPNRNKQTIRIEDRDRAMELTKAWAAERQEMLEAMRGESEPEPEGMSDEDVVKAVEDRGLWLKCLEKCSGFSDTLLHNVLVKRGTYKPIPDEFFQPQLSQKALDAIKEGSLAKHLEIRPRIEGFSDTALADELRRRGYTVTAVKQSSYD